LNVRGRIWARLKMGATNQGREKIGGKNVQRIMQNTKMNEHKKRPYKGVTLMHAYR
jgi:hypothetical protein